MPKWTEQYSKLMTIYLEKATERSSHGRGKILTAFLPWSRQELHVLHSMHCHRKAFTLTVSSVENFKQDGWPNKRKTLQWWKIKFFCNDTQEMVEKWQLSELYQIKHDAPGSLPYNVIKTLHSKSVFLNQTGFSISAHNVSIKTMSKLVLSLYQIIMLAHVLVFI